MLRAAIMICALWAADTLAAQVVVARHTVRANTVLSPGDLALINGEAKGALSDPGKAVGLETRVVLYAGRPVRADQLGPPAMVERNARVTLVYRQGGLAIVTDGRALDRGGLNDRIQVMNLASRSVVEGVITGLATVSVAP